MSHASVNSEWHTCANHVYCRDGHSCHTSHRLDSSVRASLVQATMSKQMIKDLHTTRRALQLTPFHDSSWKNPTSFCACVDMSSPVVCECCQSVSLVSHSLSRTCHRSQRVNLTGQRSCLCQVYCNGRGSNMRSGLTCNVSSWMRSSAHCSRAYDSKRWRAQRVP